MKAAGADSDLRPGWFGLATVVYATLCVGFLDPFVSTNEEVYFAWAKHASDPGWMTGSFTFEEWTGSRLLFQWIVGPILRFTSFEQLAMVGSLLNVAAIAAPLTSILRRFRFGIPEAVLLLLTFRALGQAYFGGEWIVGNFEPKTIAYVFVLIALVELFRGHAGRTVASLIAATWFHVLVGGWTYAAVSLFWLAGREPFRAVLLRGVLFAAGVAPLIAYLLAFLADAAPVRNGIHASWIYVYARNPHHAAPWLEGLPNPDFLPGMIGCLVAVLFVAMTARRGSDPALRGLNRLNGVFLAILIGALVIGAFDRHGTILKFYPFRLASLALLFTLLQAVVWVKAIPAVGDRLDRHRRPFVALALACVAAVGVMRVEKFSDREAIRRVEMAAAFARERTEPDAVFLFLADSEIEFEKIERASFMRRAERERFVVRKFIPAGDKIFEWYERLKARERVSADIGLLPALRKTHRIDYVVSRVPREAEFLREVYRAPGCVIYRVLP